MIRASLESIGRHSNYCICMFHVPCAPVPAHVLVVKMYRGEIAGSS